MVIRLTTVKSLLWFCAILFLALSFPMQVYANSPYPSLLPYLLIGLIILLNLVSPRKGRPNGINLRPNSNIDLMVGIFVCFLLLNTAWQTVFGVINFSEAMNALAIYLLPVVCYWYFRRAASEREIRSVLLAMVVASLIVGIYFAYDSYLKLALGQVSDYAYKAFQYSIDRSGQTVEDANNARINTGSRSFGLLQSHTVSGAWVALGAFAALAHLPTNRRAFRRAVILVFGGMLLLGLNFTSILAFSIIMLLFEFGGLSVRRGRRPAIIGNLVSLAIIVAIMVGVSLWVAGDVMSEYMFQNLSFQKDLLLGTGDIQVSMIGLVIENTEAYFQHISDFPLTLLLGDGFSTYGMAKGGDTGFIESIAKFGLPFFLAIVFGLLGLIKSGLRQIKAGSGGKATGGAGLDHSRILQFAICVILLVLITEGHYTVWAAKSILPIVFFALALYGRYLSVPRHSPLLKKSNEILSVSSGGKGISLPTT
jgi:hypothetical protein